MAEQGSVTSAGVGVKTLKATDIAGNTVYLQVVAIADEEGDPIEIMTETTGRAILAKLEELIKVTRNPKTL